MSRDAKSKNPDIQRLPMPLVVEVATLGLGLQRGVTAFGNYLGAFETRCVRRGEEPPTVNLTSSEEHFKNFSLLGN